MKFNLSLILFLYVFTCSCKQEEPKDFFPFKEYFTNEINTIDSLPIAIFKYTSFNNNTDTSIIEKKDFRELTVGLLSLDLQNEEIKKAYDEVVLDDVNTKNISISYTTEDKTQPIKLLQLNIKPGTTVVKNIYIERIDQANDVTILRKILWNTQKGVTISSIYYKANKIQESLTEKYSWSIQ